MEEDNTDAVEYLIPSKVFYIAVSYNMELEDSVKVTVLRITLYTSK
jgi:hypothetical protein